MLFRSHEGDVWRVGVDVAGRGSVAMQVVAAFGAVEELCLQCALQGFGGDLQLRGGGSVDQDKEKTAGKERAKRETTHSALSIKVCVCRLRRCSQ